MWVPDIRFHDLRHTHATLMLKQGIHPKIVSERLGHKSRYHIGHLLTRRTRPTRKAVEDFANNLFQNTNVCKMFAITDFA